MATQFNFKTEGCKTYATESNAIKAVESKGFDDSLRFFIMRTPEGRFFPVFMDGEKACQHGVHFHFHVI